MTGAGEPQRVELDAVAIRELLVELGRRLHAQGVRTPQEAAEIAVAVYGEESVHLTPHDDLVLIARAALALRG
ncbi:hypothetical protein [Kineococcus glutinatus]|uniref:Uncharacterized protein n=1 Tax=Kineococcus glutinatus TaxID=1070872 RepID=A0ABP9HCQ9_9ACTN